MLKFILLLTLLCGSLSAVNLRNPEVQSEENQYQVLKTYYWTFPNEECLFVVYDRLNDLYAVYLLSYFDKILQNFDLEELIQNYTKVPYEYVKDLRELKNISEDQYGLY